MKETSAAEQVLKFLRTHELISLNALEKKLGIPQSTLYKAIHDIRDLPAKHIPQLKAELKAYGLKMK